MQSRIIKILVLSVSLLMTPIVLGAARADGDVVVKAFGAKKFAVMPDGVPFPEGVTANPNNGEVIVGTFIFGPSNWLLRCSKNGELLAQVDLGPAPILGLAYNTVDDKIYFCSADSLAGVGASKIGRIDADFTDTSTVEDVADVPSIGAPPDRVVTNPDTSTDTIEFGNFAPAPNDLTFDSYGDLYYSDSFQGAVFVITNPAGTCPVGGCTTETIAHDSLLATAGFPPFGANGVALNPSETVLYVANTGDDRVLTIDLTADLPVTPNVFVESINGADGIVTDEAGRLWVAANQADQVVVLDGETGAILAKLGEFLGIQKNGTPRGLLFPASLVMVNNGKLIVTNLAFPLGSSAGEPESDPALTRYTISRINMSVVD